MKNIKKNFSTSSQNKKLPLSDKLRINSPQNDQVVAVGMSGGIDSTITAYLLKKQGYKVVGLTMMLKNDKQKQQEIKKITEKLKIKNYFIDLSKDFKKIVLDYYRQEYLNGRTPNPCIICNQKIKFDLLLKTAKKSGIQFDFFATGHYVRLAKDPKTRCFFLKKGKDTKKDQSYFLYRLNQIQLKNLIFPLGNLTKNKVKKMALQLGFKELLAKPESQDFFNCADQNNLFDKTKIKTGDIINHHKKIVGKHNGIINYTIGQRKGLSGGGTKIPMYVIKINTTKNQIMIGPRKKLLAKKLIAISPNWISIKQPEKKLLAYAKIRFGAKSAKCQIKLIENNQLKVEFKNPQFAITPGQSIVFYQKNLLLGGAIISQILI
ncbi:MAG: tRNA 2-thiouridine(34) synthase MnmA [Patescibacteria group bacterium]|nr:tRNA 2-thiouridine(34) synthase MnmA [Patescibacteria group bacterium]